MIANVASYYHAGNSNGDSTVYVYSGSRGGDLDHKIPFDTSTRYLKDYPAASPYIPSQRSVNTYTSYDSIQTHMQQLWSTSGSKFYNRSRDSYTYYASKLIAQIVTELYDTTLATWSNNYRTTYYWNSSNKQDSIHTESWANGASQPYSKSIYTYDGSGNLINSRSMNWYGYLNGYRNYGNITYIYSGANLLSDTTATWDTASNAFQNTRLEAFRYNSSGQLISQISRTYNTPGGTLVPTFDSVDYRMLTASGAPQIIENYLDYSGVTASLLTRDSIVYNAFGKQQYFLLWSSGSGGGLNMSNRGFISFNSNNQQTGYYTESYNGGAWAPSEGDVATRQYYETYSLGIAQQSGSSHSITLWPIPANSVLYISLQWNQAATLQLAITDAVGRVVCQSTFHVNGNYRYDQQLAVEDWPAGVYFLRITDGQYAINRTISIGR